MDNSLSSLKLTKCLSTSKQHDFIPLLIIIGNISSVRPIESHLTGAAENFISYEGGGMRRRMGREGRGGGGRVFCLNEAIGDSGRR